MTEPSQQEQFPLPKTNWRWFLMTIVIVFAYLGFLLVDYFTDNWVPFWIQISVSMLFFVFALGNCVFYTYEVSTNLGSDKLAGRAARVAFQPYILWVSIAVMILSWIVALILYKNLWFFIALGTTLLVLVVGFFSLRSLVQQIESTETDIL